MEPNNACQILKDSIELDESTQEAYEFAVENINEYRISVAQFYAETVASVEGGQNSMILGELMRQFYNSTHRMIDGKIVELPGSEFCEHIGASAIDVLNTITSVNTCSEEMSASTIACDDTCMIAYQ